MRELLGRTILEHRRSMDAGEYSAVDLTRAFLARIEEVEKTVGAFLTVDAEGALLAAAESDKRRANGEGRGVLEGIPYAIKDNFCTKGLPTTCASRMLEDFIPPYDATVVERLKMAGCVLLGKLNMDEFAMGSTNETSALGVTRNPRDPRYVAGGSSGGSAAAVAANEVVFAIGSDTGGSVRQPAAFCGVLGLKPTYCAISRYGMIPMASSLDCVGILARSAADTDLVFSSLCGKDGRDLTVKEAPASAAVPKELAGLRVAVVREFLDTSVVSREVGESLRCAIVSLEKRGACMEEVSLPAPAQALAAYCVLSAAEAASNMARFDGVRFGKRSGDAEDLFSLYANTRAAFFGNEVKRRILFGTAMLSEKNRARYYDAALSMREQLRLRLLELFERYDLILTPTTPTEAFLRGAVRSQAERRRADLCAVYSSLAGLPALSVPFGHSEGALPLAVQLTAAPFAEKTLFRVAEFLEKQGSAESFSNFEG